MKTVEEIIEMLDNEELKNIEDKNEVIDRMKQILIENGFEYISCQYLSYELLTSNEYSIFIDRPDTIYLLRNPMPPYKHYQYSFSTIECDILPPFKIPSIISFENNITSTEYEPITEPIKIYQEGDK